MEAGRTWSRFLRRLWRPFLNEEEKARIAEAVGEAERRTTGEIHVHIIERCPERDILDLARRAFLDLGLQKTKDRNGVLILISHLDHRFAVVGDEGIHAKAGPVLWGLAKETLSLHFAQRRYADGVEACVRAVGRQLAGYFPKADAPGRNELSDEVTEG